MQARAVCDQADAFSFSSSAGLTRVSTSRFCGPLWGPTWMAGTSPAMTILQLSTRFAKCLVIVGAFILGAVGVARAETPPAPAGAAIYGALPKGEALRLSPDGDNLAMIAADRGKRSVVVWHLDRHDPTVFHTDDLEPQWVAWKSNSQLVAGFSTAEFSGYPINGRPAWSSRPMALPGPIFHRIGISRRRPIRPI